MHAVQALLPILHRLDEDGIAPETFAHACEVVSWGDSTDDGIGLWEVEEPVFGTQLILDTVTTPISLICRLACDDEYEPAALLAAPLRDKFDSLFTQAAAVLASSFSVELGRGTCDRPHDWKFAHFRGQRVLAALEQTYYDPIMGVQLLLVLQPLPIEMPKTAVTSTW